MRSRGVAREGAARSTCTSRPAWTECSISESWISNSKAPGRGVARSNATHAVSSSRTRRITFSVYLGLLADHVQERLALLVADDLERARQRVGQCRRVFDLLGVPSGGAADELIVGRRFEIRQRHAAGL